MARQPIPRSDLYGDLGVDPSSDTDAIEAAYQAQIGDLSARGSTRDVRRAARLRLAREWLTDPDLRRRYDASRARAAARAASATSPTPEDEPTAPVQIPPWPARDLQRGGTGIAWSSTPVHDEDEPPRRRPTAPIGVLALLGLAAIVFLATWAIAGNFGSGGTATATPTPPPTASSAASDPGTSAEPGTEPSAAATPEPTSAPTPAPTPAGPNVATMQQAAWDTIAALRAAVEAGDVAAAQPLLGDTAPGLRRSGLRRAELPEVEPVDIDIQAEGAGYVALAGSDEMTSPDGLTWTFNYGERALASYRMAENEPEHDVWWVETDGEHHLQLHVVYAAIARSSVIVRIAWAFDPARPDDPAYFGNATMVIAAAEMDGEDLGVQDDALLIGGRDAITMTGTTAVEAGVGEELAVTISIGNPADVGADPRLIESSWTLTVR